MRPEGRQLAQIARLMDAGELRPVVRETLPLAEAATAYTLAQPGGGPGKIALHIAAPESMAEN